jgi:hypothetical protein
VRLNTLKAHCVYAQRLHHYARAFSTAYPSDPSLSAWQAGCLVYLEAARTALHTLRLYRALHSNPKPERGDSHFVSDVAWDAWDFSNRQAVTAHRLFKEAQPAIACSPTARAARDGLPPLLTLLLTPTPCLKIVRPPTCVLT